MHQKIQSGHPQQQVSPEQLRESFHQEFEESIRRAREKYQCLLERIGFAPFLSQFQPIDLHSRHAQHQERVSLRNTSLSFHSIDQHTDPMPSYGSSNSGGSSQPLINFPSPQSVPHQVIGQPLSTPMARAPYSDYTLHAASNNDLSISSTHNWGVNRSTDRILTPTSPEQFPDAGWSDKMTNHSAGTVHPEHFNGEAMQITISSSEDSGYSSSGIPRCQSCWKTELVPFGDSYWCTNCQVQTLMDSSC